MASLTMWARGLLLALVLVLAAPASALADCGTTIINDYLKDGTINGTYSQACYQQALGEIPTDAEIYTDIRASITAAMTRAGGGPTTDQGTTDSTDTSAAAAGGSTDGGVVGQALNGIGPKEADQVPMPVIILGVLFLVLILAGIGGVIAQRRSRKRDGDIDPTAGDTSAPETAV
jgi:hypothetical protein